MSKTSSTRKPVMGDVPSWFSDMRIPYFVTGSVRFGVAGSSSDLDIAVTVLHRVAVLEIIARRGLKAEPSEYNAGVKVMWEGVAVNFVFLHPLDYCCWFRAAQMACSCGIFKGVRLKSRRMAIHEMLCATAKSSFSEGDPITGLNFEEFCKGDAP